MRVERHIAPEIEIISPEGRSRVYCGWNIATVILDDEGVVEKVSVAPFEQELPLTIYHATRYVIQMR